MKLLILHLLITLIITILCSIRANKQEIILNALIMLFFPIGGVIIVLLFRLTKNRAKKMVEEDEFEEDVLLFTDKICKENYKNVVSLEETLILNEDKIKREQLIEQLKKDALDYISVLKKAVRDDDIETSHYASSAIVEVKRKLELDIQKFDVDMESNEENIDFLNQYKEVLKTYIESDILDKYSLHKYTNTYKKISVRLVELQPNKESYKELIDILIKTNDLEECKSYCYEFLSNIPSEEAYVCLLRYCYNSKNKKEFNSILNELINSKIQLSPSGLQLVRFWKKEV